MPPAPKVVLTIAGFDPSSGAGVTADIKTIAAHNCYGVACITALTVQSTSRVSRVEPLAADLVSSTLRELAEDLELSAVKIGMLGSVQVTRTVAEFLEELRPPNIVLDPILQSSSGTPLLDREGQEILVSRLLPLADVITPNVDEAAVLAGLPDMTNLLQMKKAATRIHELGSKAVVITGGHMEKAVDLLSYRTRDGKVERQVFRAERQRSTSTHGTGCAFSTAIACHLAEGRRVPESVLLAKAYVTAAITNAYPLGRGVGPVHHLYRMHQNVRRPEPVRDPEPVS
jgi:hydroxymethylpyrimidine/phosphomethylpyrimidine kinase